MPSTPPLSLLNRAWTTPPALLTGQSQVSEHFKTPVTRLQFGFIVQELCESRGGRPELSVLTSLLASVDVKIY